MYAQKKLCWFVSPLWSLKVASLVVLPLSRRFRGANLVRNWYESETVNFLNPRTTHFATPPPDSRLPDWLLRKEKLQTANGEPTGQTRDLLLVPAAGSTAPCLHAHSCHLQADGRYNGALTIRAPLVARIARHVQTFTSRCSFCQNRRLPRYYLFKLTNLCNASSFSLIYTDERIKTIAGFSFKIISQNKSKQN